MIKIQATNGETVILDDEDFQRLNKSRICPSSIGGVRCFRLMKSGHYLHRVLFGSKATGIPIFSNGNNLDYRRNNVTFKSRIIAQLNKKKIYIEDCPLGRTEFIKSKTQERPEACQICCDNMYDEHYLKCLNIACQLNWNGWKIKTIV